MACWLQDILNGPGGRPEAVDASGNPILKDVGPWLRSQFKAHFKDAGMQQQCCTATVLHGKSTAWQKCCTACTHVNVQPLLLKLSQQHGPQLEFMRSWGGSIPLYVWYRKNIPTHAHARHGSGTNHCMVADIKVRLIPDCTTAHAREEQGPRTLMCAACRAGRPSTLLGMLRNFNQPLLQTSSSWILAF
jgi:hypothetical protein